MFVSLNGSLTPSVSGADKVRLAAKVGYGGVDWDLGPAKTAGARRDEGAVHRAERSSRRSRTCRWRGRCRSPARQRRSRKGSRRSPTMRRSSPAVGCRKMMLVLPATAPTHRKRSTARLVVERLSAVSAAAAEVEPAAGARVPRAALHAIGAGRDGQPRDAVHLDAAGDRGTGEGLRPQHGRGARRLALAPLRRHDPGHPRRRRRSHRPRPHLRRQAGAAGGRARQPARHAGRRAASISSASSRR